MAYFDSPKNRAFWERRLSVLREEKERRSRTGYAPQEEDRQRRAAPAAENPFRTRMTFAELEREVTERTAERRAEKLKERGRSLQNRRVAGAEKPAPARGLGS